MKNQADTLKAFTQVYRSFDWKTNAVKTDVQDPSLQWQNNPSDAPKKPRLITVLSGKGGVGKSCIVVNLSLIVAARGKKTVVIDADLSLGNVDVLLGLSARYHLGHVLSGEKQLAEVILSAPKGLKIIPASSGMQQLSQLNTDQMQDLKHIFKMIDYQSDWVFLDAGAGMSESVLQLAQSSAECLVVLTPDPTSLTDAYAMIKVLQQRGQQQLSVCCNMVQNEQHGLQVFQKLSAVTSKFLNFKPHFLGSVPTDHCVVESVQRQKPLALEYRRSSAYKALQKICFRLMASSQQGAQTSGITALLP